MKSVAWATPVRSSTSPKSIDREGPGESRTGSKQGRSDDRKRSIKWPGGEEEEEEEEVNLH